MRFFIIKSFAEKNAAGSIYNNIFSYPQIKKQPRDPSGSRVIRQGFIMVIILLLSTMGVSSSGTINFSSQYAIAEPSSCDNTIEGKAKASSNNDFVYYENDNLGSEGRLVAQYPANWTVDELHDSIPTPIHKEIVQFFAPLQEQNTTDEIEGDLHNASLTIIENPYLANITRLEDYLEETVNGTHERVRGAVDMQVLQNSSAFFLGFPAYRVEGEIILASSNKHDQETIKFLQVGTIIENRTGFYVKYLAKSSEYEKNLNAVDIMISSLKIVEDKDINVGAVNNNSTYCNNNFGIKIRYPSDWSKADIRSDSTPVVFYSPQEDGEFDGFWELLMLKIEPAIEGTPLHEFVRQKIINEYRFLPDSNLTAVTVKEITQRDPPAFNSTVQYYDKVSKHILRVQDFITIKDGVAYNLKYIADQQDYTKYAPIIKEIIDSFEINEYSAAREKLTQQNLEQGVKLNGFPIHISVNPETNTVYVANYLSNFVSVIDGNDSSRVLDTIDVGKRPIEVDTSSDRYANLVYVINERSNGISIIDGASNRVVETLTGLEEPLAIKVDPNTQTIYIANSSHLTVIDGWTYDIKSKITLPNMSHTENFPEIYIATDSYKDMVYISKSCGNCSNSIISVLNASSASNYTMEAGKVVVANGSISSLAINPVKGLLYASIPQYGAIAVMNLSTIDVSKNETILINIENLIKLEDEDGPFGNVDLPYVLDVNPKDNKVYVVSVENTINRERTGIHVINGTDRISEGFIQLNGSLINTIKVDPYRNFVYAADRNSNILYKINGNTNKLIYGLNLDISPPNSGIMDCTITGDTGYTDRPPVKVWDNTRLEVDHGTKVSCTATPHSNDGYFPVVSHMQELFSFRDISDDYVFSEFSVEGIEHTNNNLEDNITFAVNGHQNLTANFEQMDPALPSSQLQAIQGVIATAILTSGIGGAVRLYQKRKKKKNHSN